MSRLIHFLSFSFTLQNTLVIVSNVGHTFYIISVKRNIFKVDFLIESIRIIQINKGVLWIMQNFYNKKKEKQLKK